MIKTKNDKVDLVVCVMIIVGMIATAYIGYSSGFKDGSEYTYNRVYILFTNSLRQAASDLDCKMTNSSITIEKRAAPLKCCYPLNCPQAKDNPKDCNCEYMIYCGPF